MATYLILGLAVTAITLTGALRLKRTAPARRDIRLYLAVVLALFAMTAVFDNLIVGLAIVDYDRSTILGLYIGYAPVEDFFYPLVAAYLLPILWSRR